MVTNSKQKAKGKKQIGKQKHQDNFLKTYLESLGNISEACSGIRKTIGGFIWRLDTNV